MSETKTPTHEEASEILHRFVNAFFGNEGPKPRISIPADPTRDDDLRMTAYIEGCKAELTAAQAEVAEYKPLIAKAAEAMGFARWFAAAANLTPFDESPGFSSKLTGALFDMQNREADAKQAAEGLRAALEMLVGPDQSYMNNITQSITMQMVHEARKALSAAPAPGWSHPDAKRLDWMEREGHALEWDDTRPGVVRASDGREFYGDTLREAIDAALKDETPPAPSQP